MLRPYSPNFTNFVAFSVKFGGYTEFLSVKFANCLDRIFILSLTDQPQPVQLPLVLRPGGEEVEAGGLDAAVAQHVRQLYNILAGPVEGRGEQVPQIVGEHLGGLHPRRPAQALHLRPDLGPGQTFSASGEKNLPGGDFLLLGVLQQLAAEFAGNEDGADLALQGDLRPPRFCRLHRDVPHLADPDAGAADGLHHQGQPVSALRLGGADQPRICTPVQLPPPVPEGPPLELQKFDPLVPPAPEAEEAVEGS